MSSNIHDDDEDQNVPYADSPGTLQQDQVENVQLVWHSNDKAPLQDNTQQVMLELIDASSTRERFGLDLVAVLDVSASMDSKHRLDKMKTAMQFVIKKLSPIDRLSIVTFSSEAKRRCHLRSMTQDTQAGLKNIVNSLIADGGTNIQAGLVTGHKILKDRRIAGGRVASMFLLSDGDEGIGQATTVDVSDVPVYTFGFGAEYDPMVLDEIARKSKGGTFSFVGDEANMSEPFSQILGGLLSVVLQDLKLTVSPQRGDSTIEKVDAGLLYPCPPGTFTVSFGDLFAREVRKIIVDILLPAVTVHRRKREIAFAYCTYSIRGQSFFSRKFMLTIIRTGSVDPNVRKPEAMRTELARRRHANYLEESRTMVDRNDLKSAKNKLVEAKNDLELEQTNSMIEILRTHLDKLLKLISPSSYGQLRAYLRSLKTSHDRQRIAATGDVKGDRLFETPITGILMWQAKEFEENPAMEVRPVTHDFIEEKRLRDQQGIKKETSTWCWDWDWESHHERSRWAWAMVILCTVLAVGVIVIGVALFAVYLLYKPKMPYLVVSDAQLGALQYAQQDGTIRYLQLLITILAENNNSKADATFSRVNLALQFHGDDVALLRTPAPFVVAPESSLPLQYDVVSAGRTLDPAGMRSMDESLSAGVVPFDLRGKARTRWKVGIFLKVHFWTRISCRLHFFFPGNSTVMPTDLRRCRSRSP